VSDDRRPGQPRRVTEVRAGQGGVRAFGVTATAPAVPPPVAVLLDRQGSILRSLCARSPTGGRPAYPALRRSLDGLRSLGARIGVASHNRGQVWEEFDVDEIEAMQDRIEPALGTIDLWCVCLIDPGGTCACETAGLGMIETTAEAVGIPVEACVVAAGDQRLAGATERVGATNLLAPGQCGTGAGPRERSPAEDATALVKAVDRVATACSLDRSPGPD
jgi:D-glycero-D-manno-heptose 1,7-bisphosphate phosphatase